MSVEGFKAFFDVGAIILLFLTFAFGVGAFFTGNVINKRQAEQLRQFDKSLTDAKTDLAIQQERAAELEKENLVLQQKLTNRRITKEQHDVVVGFLKKRPGTIIIETMGDSESGLYAADFLKTFTDANWVIGGKHFPLGVVWIGLIVYDSPDPHALTVAQALKAAGIAFSIGTEKRDKATIMIGSKAPGF